MAAMAQPVAGAALSEEKIELIVKNYLMENPQIVAEIMNNTQRHVIEQEEARKAAMVRAKAGQIYNDKRDFSIGNPDAAITVVEFFDYNCGYCKRAFPDVIKLTQNNEDVRVVLKEFPILGPPSLQAARASLAAKADGKYFKIHQALLNARSSLNATSLNNVLKQNGLDPDSINQSGKSAEIRKQIEDVRNLAQELGINGTPAFIINDVVYSGALGYEEMQRIIDEVRKGNEG